jgi:hypothetical protein
MNEIKPLAWFGDPALKEEVVLRMKEHRAEDSIIQGDYQVYAPEKATQYRGCLLGCTLPPEVNAQRVLVGSNWGWQRRVADAYGIPRGVAFYLENVFEGLPFDEAADFAVESIEAIPVGADLTAVDEYWNYQTENDLEWWPGEEKDKLLDMLRNAPVPEPVQ